MGGDYLGSTDWVGVGNYIGDFFVDAGNGIASWWDGLRGGGNSVVDSGITTVPTMYLSDYYFEKSRGKTGRAGIKKKGKEGLQKGRNNGKFKPKVTPRPQDVTDIVNPSAHVPSKRGHRKYDPRGNSVWWLIFILLGYYFEEE